MINTTYIIVPVEDVINEMIEESLNESNTLRYSLDGSKVIIKYNSKFPNSAKGYTKYTHDQIILELQKPEWTE